MFIIDNGNELQGSTHPASDKLKVNLMILVIFSTQN